MALVNQSNKYPAIKINQDVGPGSYKPDVNYKVKNPLVVNTNKEKYVKPKKDNYPGPGQYDNQDLLKLIEQNQQQLIEQKSVPFSCEIPRFSEPQNAKNPGPGYYQQQKKQKIQKSPQELNINHIIQLSNNVNIIPSVPGSKNTKGYTDLNGKLYQNKPANMIYDGLDKKIAPNRYNLIDTFDENKIKRCQWSKCKISRFHKLEIQTLEQCGPGTYSERQLKKNENLSSGFASKSHRTGVKLEIGKKFIMNKVKQQIQYMLGDDAQKEEIEIFNDEMPGPAHYQKQNTPKKKPGKKNDNFQQDTLRWKHQKSTSIGPGLYSPLIPQHVSHLSAQTPFMTTAKRFQKKQIPFQPAPNTYNPKNQFEDRLIKKVQSGYQGQFGSNVKKFTQEKQPEQSPGPGQYLNPDIIAYSNYQNFIQKKKNFFFQSEQKRDLYPQKDDDFRDYQQSQFSIETNLQKKQFNSPFQGKKTKSIKKENNDIEIKNKTEQNFYPKQDKKQLPFNTTANRFRYKDNMRKSVGPGSYNDTFKNTWKKKTFNILFAEI